MLGTARQADHLANQNSALLDSLRKLENRNSVLEQEQLMLRSQKTAEMASLDGQRESIATCN